jgi:hypothetical protein
MILNFVTINAKMVKKGNNAYLMTSICRSCMATHLGMVLVMVNIWFPEVT